MSSKVVDDLGFIPVGFASIGTVGGDTIETKEYRVDLGIPVQIGNNEVFGVGRSISVALLPYQPPNFDVLLGMDFISGYHITLFGNQIVISN